MSEETTVKIKLHEDGTVIQVLADGSERILESQTDWERVDAMTDEEIEEAALSDPDCPPSRVGQFRRHASQKAKASLGS